MPIKKKKVGTGITQRERLSFEMPLSEEEIEVWKSSWDALCKKDFSFEGLYGRPLDGSARQILKKAGIDPEKLPTVPIEEDSPEAYAQKISNTLRVLRNYRESDPDLALRLAFELGSMAQEADMKFRWESSALRGHGQELTLQRNRDARSADARRRHQYLQSRADDIWRNRPNLSVRAVATNLRKEIRSGIAEGHILLWEKPPHRASIRRVIKDLKPTTKKS